MMKPLTNDTLELLARSIVSQLSFQQSVQVAVLIIAYCWSCGRNETESVLVKGVKEYFDGRPD